MDDDEIYERHKRYNGQTPRGIFLEKKRFVRSRPVFRPEQYYADYSPAYRPITNPDIKRESPGQRVHFGPEGVEYLSFIGLRADEKQRVKRIRQRYGGENAEGYEGEYLYLPLSDMGITSEDITAFWGKQTWDLGLAKDGSQSNCTYCFLKGIRGLRRAHTLLSENPPPDWKGTPCDINWWIRIERQYGRDMIAEKRSNQEKDCKQLFWLFWTYYRVHISAPCRDAGHERGNSPLRR